MAFSPRASRSLWWLDEWCLFPVTQWVIYLFPAFSQAHVPGALSGPHHSGGHGPPPMMLLHAAPPPPQQGPGSGPGPQHPTHAPPPPQQGTHQHYAYIGPPPGKASAPGQNPNLHFLFVWLVFSSFNAERLAPYSQKNTATSIHFSVQVYRKSNLVLTFVCTMCST